MSRLAAEGLVIRRGGRTILDRIDLAFGPAELVAVIGPNGAGKSTLLAALAGLITPETGAVRLDGQPLAAFDRRALARRRAYLPQNPRAEWPLPVGRLAALGLTPHLPPFGPLPAAMRARVDATLAALDLTDRADQPATTLSGGELARAMLARALVGDPDVLIVDEPIAGLDPRHALDAMDRLRAQAGRGKLVIAALHDLTLAARFSTRLVALSGGRLVADGTTGRVLTAELVGALFEVEAEVVGSGMAVRVDFALPTLPG